MLYSRAIRQGLSGTTKAIGVYFREDENGRVSELCVQGAALRGIGVLSTNTQYDNAMLMERYFNYTQVARVPYTRIPDKGIRAIKNFMVSQGTVQLLEATINMNNETEMTREEIADWVEEMEREFIDSEVLSQAELAVH